MWKSEKKLKIRHGKFTKLWTLSYGKNYFNWNKTHDEKVKQSKTYQLKSAVVKNGKETTDTKTKTTKPKKNRKRLKR